MHFRPDGMVQPKRPVGVECAQCGAQLLAPDWSEYVQERRLRHLWSCEPCGYSFETTISFAATGVA
jgi:transcription elongation factor Elf1